MGQTHASEVVLIRVATADREVRVWAAAMPRDEAIARVLTLVPAGATAELADFGLKPQDCLLLSMMPGEIRELHVVRTQAGTDPADEAPVDLPSESSPTSLCPR